MKFRAKLEVGLLQKPMVLLIFSLLLVSSSADKNETTSNIGSHKQEDNELQQGVQVRLHRRLHYPFDMFYSNKRRVPNTSDPLHNR